jgi:hypothetical protein
MHRIKLKTLPSNCAATRPAAFDGVRWGEIGIRLSHGQRLARNLLIAGDRFTLLEEPQARRVPADEAIAAGMADKGNGSGAGAVKKCLTHDFQTGHRADLI